MKLQVRSRLMNRDRKLQCMFKQSSLKPHADDRNSFCHMCQNTYLSKEIRKVHLLHILHQMILPSLNAMVNIKSLQAHTNQIFTLAYVEKLISC